MTYNITYQGGPLDGSQGDVILDESKIKRGRLLMFDLSIDSITKVTYGYMVGDADAYFITPEPLADK